MARETKVGLLVGLCIILGFAWILSSQMGASEMHDERVIERSGGGHVGLVHVSTPADPITREQERRHALIGDAPTEVADTGRAESVRRGSLDSLFHGDLDGVVLLDTSSDVYGRVRRDAVPSGGAGVELVRETTPVHEAVVERRIVNPVPTMRQYTVKAGDSLYAIAESQYGRGRGELWKEIARVNGITDPGRIRANMTLKIPNIDPPAVEIAAASGPATGTGAAVVDSIETRLVSADTRPASSGSVIHEVKAGETLGAISQQYYSTSRKWKLIQDANSGLDPNAMPIGQKIVIPADTTVAVASIGTGSVAPAGGAGLSGDVEWALREVEQAIAPVLGTRVYVVQPGETLWSISSRELGSPSRISEIRQLNRLSGDSIRRGQQLLLPTAANVAMVEGVRR